MMPAVTVDTMESLLAKAIEADKDRVEYNRQLRECRLFGQWTDYKDIRDRYRRAYKRVSFLRYVAVYRGFVNNTLEWDALVIEREIQEAMEALGLDELTPAC